jgi:UPF0042 nucleotide-binding protein
VAEFVVITGLSGAGRTQAGDILEDLGWFVIDNLPPSLIPKVVELSGATDTGPQRVALVVGTGPFHDEVLPAIQSLRSQEGRLRVLFLEAGTETLVRRYEDTRRRHPLADEVSLADAIEAERTVLEPVKGEADVVVDTTELNVHQLRHRVEDLFARETDAGMRITISSFGYKHGLPLDVDIVMDLRFLPNPHWVEDLRLLTGLDAPVQAYIEDQPETEAFLDAIGGLLAMLLPAYQREGKSYLTVAFGCTGGRHRSVAVSEAVAARLRADGWQPTVTHRDLER